MIVDNINKINPVCRVLVVPLDWGLGHATRCIPIINILTKHNIEVILAGEGDIPKILGKAQPKLVILRLKGYRVKYSRSKKFFFLKMLLQFPKIIAAIRNERRWLKKTIADHNIDAVISDNRFGLHCQGTASVFITHQLSIQTGNKWLDRLAQRINYHFINKFDECWVPDMAGNANLAGKLSHPDKLPNKTVNYLGVLSRFKKTPVEKKYDLLIMLSGPEPQRSIFENILLSQLKSISGTIVLVRGLPAEEKKLMIENDQLVIHNHLPAEALNELILQSKNIVARCGYSTVMDLFTLQQKAALVATPGQTEQEYLAVHLMENKIFFTCTQQNFSLKETLESIKHFNFSGSGDIPRMQSVVIENWIERLKTKVIITQ